MTDGGAIFLVLLLGAVTLAIDLAQRNRETHTPMLELTPVLQGALYGVFVVSILVFSGGETVPFIYFQF